MHLLLRSETVKLSCPSTARYNYDRKDQLTNLRWEKSGGGVAASFSYEYDKVGNRTEQKLDHLGLTIRYGYNDVYWLTSERWLKSASSLSSFANQFVNIAGGNESGFSDEVTAMPENPGITFDPYWVYWNYIHLRSDPYRRESSTYPILQRRLLNQATVDVPMPEVRL
jgi:hypothetical protein